MACRRMSTSLQRDFAIRYAGRAAESLLRPQAVLFRNARVFDGVSDVLTPPQCVLTAGNKIARVAADVAAPKGLRCTEVDCGGRTLMPGLIDMHTHVALQNGMREGNEYDQMAMGAMAGNDLWDHLLQGFTSLRDAGGNVLGISNAIAANRLVGPRLHPSGAMLSQTGGHGDTGLPLDAPGEMDPLERAGLSYIVDGVPEVLKAARNNMRNGASQLKIMGGGGVASVFDPIHVTQFLPEEIRAVVDVAKSYGTYVMVHAYHDASVNMALDCGVKSIEHGFLMSEETVKRMKRENAVLSLQAVMSLEAFADPDSITFFSPAQRQKAKEINKNALQVMKWALKHDVLMVSGGDMFGDAYQPRQADNIRWLSKIGMSNFHALRTATSDAAKVLSWSKMHKYQEAEVGVIREGAYADLIVLDGNPLEDLSALARDAVRVVLKDGKTYKYTLDDTTVRPSVP